MSWECIGLGNRQTGGVKDTPNFYLFTPVPAYPRPKPFASIISFHAPCLPAQAWLRLRMCSQQPRAGREGSDMGAAEGRGRRHREAWYRVGMCTQGA